MNNLNNHHFQDPDSHKIRRHLNGLVQKLRVNSQVKKAERLQELFDSYLSKNTSEYNFSKLFLLSLVSTSPLHSEILHSPISNDLSNMLKETIYLSSEEESSLEWESSSEISEEIEKETEKEEKTVEKVFEDAPSPVETEITEETEELKIEIGRSYENPCTLADQFYESLCKKEKKIAAQGYVLPWPYTRLTEREVVDKVLLMLLGLNNEQFEFTENKFKLVQKIEVSHLTPSSLNSILKFFTELASKLLNLNFKCEVLSTDECVTFQYFGHGCKEILSEFRKQILSIQEEFSVQSGNYSRKALQKFPGKNVTLISLKSQLVTISDHVQLIQGIIERLSENPALKTLNLLNHLYSLIMNNYSLTDHSAFSVFVRLFLTSFQPFLSDLCKWLTQGSLLGVDLGFMIEKSSDKNMQQDSWQLAFTIKKFDGIELVPIFLEEVKDEILTIGKNMMLIRKIEETVLEHVLPPPSKILICLEKLILSSLFEHSAHFLNSCRPKEKLTISSISWDRNVPYQITLLPLKFDHSFVDSREDKNGDLMNPTEFKISEYLPKIEFDVSPMEAIKSWISFKHVLQQTISTAVKQLHSDTCSYILELLHSKFQLNRYFKSIREILLLENAESMRPLLKFINKNPDLSRVRINLYELNNTFLECIKTTTNKDLQKYFSCELKFSEIPLNQIDSIDLIKINFSAPNPLDICFDENAISIYQKLNTRILQIKRAVHCAKSNKWRSRANKDKNIVKKKYLIFQKKLIHFTCCFEEYILQDVLHSCANWFLAEKEKVESIDELRKLHQNYLNKALDRCLLSAEKSPLSSAVNAVFGCCVKFYELMRRICNENFESIESRAVFEDLQQNFETANRILLQVLSKNLQNKRQMQCKKYLDSNSYFTMNFNRYYIND